jgi:hypothetical protein
MVCVGLVDAASMPTGKTRSVRPQALAITVMATTTKSAHPDRKRRRSIFMISTRGKRRRPGSYVRETKWITL